MMSLSLPWLLVIARQDKTSINAGMLLLFYRPRRIGADYDRLLAMGSESGSLDFASFARFHFLRGWRRRCFCWPFRFWRERGMMPLTSWLPARSPPAAPSHASALMSGVMVKIGIFGILKVSDGPAGANGFAAVVGILVMAIGAIRALGVLYALAEQDIKRLLAWSTPSKRRHYFCWQSGVAMVGRHRTTRCSPWLDCSAHVSSAQPCAVQRAAIFGARARLFRVAYPTTWKNRGTGKRMPWIAAACLIGCLAISAISSAEWFYQRMVHLEVCCSLKSCGRRSATTCGSYCHGNAGSHWWAGSNVPRKNVRYYFLRCAAQYTR